MSKSIAILFICKYSNNLGCDELKIITEIEGI